MDTAVTGLYNKFFVLLLERYLKFGKYLLLNIFKAKENIQPCLLTKEKFDSFDEAIAQNYKLLSHNK
eukprot:1698048-Ditylum_brightwellii.AAC.1